MLDNISHKIKSIFRNEKRYTYLCKCKNCGNQVDKVRNKADLDIGEILDEECPVCGKKKVYPAICLIERVD